MVIKPPIDLRPVVPLLTVSRRLISACASAAFAILVVLLSMLPVDGSSDPDLTGTLWKHEIFDWGAAHGLIFFNGKPGNAIKFGYIDTFDNKKVVLYEGNYNNGHLSLNGINIDGYEKLEIDLDLRKHQMHVKQTGGISRSDPANIPEFTAICQNCVGRKFESSSIDNKSGTGTGRGVGSRSLLPPIGAAGAALAGVMLGRAVGRRRNRKKKRDPKTQEKIDADVELKVWPDTIRGDEVDFVYAAVVVTPKRPSTAVRDLKATYLGPGIHSTEKALGPRCESLNEHQTEHQTVRIKAIWSEQDDVMSIDVTGTVMLIDHVARLENIIDYHLQKVIPVVGAKPSLEYQLIGDPNTDGSSKALAEALLTLFDAPYNGGFKTGPIETLSPTGINLNEYFTVKKTGHMKQKYELAFLFHLKDDKSLRKLTNNTIKISFPVTLTGKGSAKASIEEKEFFKRCKDEYIGRLPVAGAHQKPALEIALKPSIIDLLPAQDEVLPKKVPGNDYSPELELSATVLSASGSPVKGDIINNAGVDLNKWIMKLVLHPQLPTRRNHPLRSDDPKDPEEKSVKVNRVDDNGRINFVQQDGITVKSCFEYNHIEYFKLKGKDYVHLRGDGAYVLVTLDADGVIFPPLNTPGRQAGRKIEIKVEPWLDVANYARTNYPDGDRVTSRAKNDNRVKFFVETAELEDWLQYEDFTTCSHDFYKNSTRGKKDEWTRRIPHSATYAYYCHDYAWKKDPKKRTERMNPRTDGHDVVTNPGNWGFQLWQTAIQGTKVQPSKNVFTGLLEKTHPKLENLFRYKKDYIIAYYNSKVSYDDRKPDHSAIVTDFIKEKGFAGYIEDNPNHLVLESKDTNNSLFIHRLGNDARDNYFRSIHGAYALEVYKKI